VRKGRLHPMSLESKRSLSSKATTKPGKVRRRPRTHPPQKEGDTTVLAYLVNCHGGAQRLLSGRKQRGRFRYAEYFYE